MTALKVIILAIALVFGGAALSAAQVAPPARDTAVAPNLQIVSPTDGQKLSVDYVNIQFQVTNPAAAANDMPTFQVSLDGGDPVQTSTMTHTFTGLAPGEHTVRVEMIDANSTPVSGTRTEVHFLVTPQASAPAHSPGEISQQYGGEIRNASANRSANPQSDLPSAGSGLPLLSVIGFGVLVGGIASALKTR